MINKRIIVGTFVVFSTAALAAAQEPGGSGQPQTAPRPQAAAAATRQPSTTLVGCLYREEQVPGRRPNVAERAGILEDYILMNATMPGPPRTGATGGAAGTSGTMPVTGNMYKVENLPDERLKALVGKRVEVTGRIDPEGLPAAVSPGAPTGAPTHGSLGPDEINLPEFEAASIREIPGTCPVAPAPRK